MNLLQTLEAEQMKAVRAKPHPEFRAGDTLKVNVKVVEVSYDEKAKPRSAASACRRSKASASRARAPGSTRASRCARSLMAKARARLSDFIRRWSTACMSCARAGCAGPSSITCAAAAGKGARIAERVEHESVAAPAEA